MKFELHDAVALERDLPDHGLLKGDVGVVVQIFDSEALDVEFARASGATYALVTLESSEVRALSEADLLTIRRLPPRA